MPDPAARGRFVWHELATTDTKAAAAFYTKVMGWKTQAWEQDPSYVMWLTADGPVGGLMVLPAEAKAMGAPPHWMPYIGVPDIEVTSWDADRLGARVLVPVTQIPTMGRFAVLQDPQGAVFAIYQPAPGSPPQYEGKARLGEFSWHELATTDHEAAFRFYQQLFGWQKTESMDMGPERGVYQMYGWPGNTLGGMYNKPKEMPAPPHWLCYAVVPDARKTATLVKSLGGQVLNGPMEVPGESGDWIAQCLDPQGAAFAIHSLKPAAAKAATKATPAKKAAARKPARKAAKKAGKKQAGRKKSPKAKVRARKAVKKKTAKKGKKAKRR